MSSARFYLECKWGARYEDAAACAERVAAMLGGLAPLHPAFSRWCKQGWSRSAADHPFCTMPPRVDELTKVIQRRPYRRGFPKGGFWLGAWNGQDSSYGMAVHAHIGSDSGFRAFPNCIELTIRHLDATNSDLVNATILSRALKVCALAWQPNWALIGTWTYWCRWGRAEPWNDEQREAKQKDERRGIQPRDGYMPSIHSGWMTYLCPDYARRVTRPPGIEVEPVAGGGALLIATRDVFTPGNPAHDAVADAIQDALLPLQNLPCDAMRR